MDFTSVRLAARRYVPRPLRRWILTSVVWRTIKGRLPYHYEKVLLQVLTANVQPGDNVVDVGGHQGRIALALAQMVGPTGHVTTFEPFPVNALRIAERVKRNLVAEWVTVEAKAVTEAGADYVALYPGRDDATEEWNIVGQTVTGEIVAPRLQVPATALDKHFVGGVGIKLIKINVLGAEALVVRGAQQLIERSKPILVVLTHREPHGLSVREELRGFKYEMFDTNGRLLSAEDPLPYIMLARPAAT